MKLSPVDQDASNKQWQHYLAAIEERERRQEAYLRRLREGKTRELETLKARTAQLQEAAAERKRDRDEKRQRLTEAKYLSWTKRAQYEPKNLAGSESLIRCVTQIEPLDDSSSPKKYVHREPTTGFWELKPGVVVNEQPSSKSTTSLFPNASETNSLCCGGIKWQPGLRSHDAAKAEKNHGVKSKLYRIETRAGPPKGLHLRSSSSFDDLSSQFSLKEPVPHFPRKQLPRLQRLSTDEVNNACDALANERNRKRMGSFRQNLCEIIDVGDLPMQIQAVQIEEDDAETEEPKEQEPVDPVHEILMAQSEDSNEVSSDEDELDAGVVDLQEPGKVAQRNPYQDKIDELIKLADSLRYARTEAEKRLLRETISEIGRIRRGGSPKKKKGPTRRRKFQFQGSTEVP